MNAQDRWKNYLNELVDCVPDRDLERWLELRSMMREIRSEAALERIVARQARTIEEQAQHIEELEANEARIYELLHIAQQAEITVEA